MAIRLHRQARETNFFPGIDMPKLSPAIPIRSEKDRMTAILDCLDADIDRQRQVASKLLHLESGLTNDLLKGRVRVPANKGDAA